MADKPIDFERVPDADIPPGRRVCSLIVETTAGNHVATGWFWGTHTVITAGHAVNVAGLIRIHVLPGRNGQGPGRFGHFVTDLVEAGDFGDFAAVFVREPVGTGVGAFGLASDLAVSRAGQQATVVGYWFGDSGAQQFRGVGQITDDNGTRLRYSLFTEEGLSGAPVWVDGNDTQAIGIHTDPGAGLKITDAVADRLNGWLTTEAGRVSVPFMRFAPPLAGSRMAQPMIAAAAAPTSPGSERVVAAYSNLAPLGRVATDLAGMVSKGIGERKRVAVRIRTQPGPWERVPYPTTLLIEEQALLTALASNLPGISVTVPQLTNLQHSPVDSESVIAASPTPQLDIAMCVDGDRTVGCATLLDQEGVVLAGQTWAPEISADFEVPLLPTVTGRGESTVDESKPAVLQRVRKTRRRRKRPSVKRRR
jgi:V8-like Glu-specific endopeptidase